MANKGIQLRNRIDENHVLNSRPAAETAHGERSEAVEKVEDVEIPAMTKEAADPAADAIVAGNGLAGSWVKAGFLGCGVLLDLVAQMKQGREAVGELQDTSCSNNACEACKVRNGGANDIGDGPVGGDKENPQNLSGADGERRSVEKLDGNVVVDDC